MVGFLRFVLIVFLVLVLLGFISRILLRVFLKRLARKMGYQEPARERKEGETHINTTPRHDKKVNGDVGEYVDFEEIKE